MDRPFCNRHHTFFYMSDFFVLKKEVARKQCFACSGVGFKMTTVQGHKIKYMCGYCGGRGYTAVVRTTEVDLEEALREIWKQGTLATLGTMGKVVTL
jgi:hypothetical protein